MAGRSPTRSRFAVGTMVVLVAFLFPAAAGAKVKDASGLYVPKPNPDAIDQIAGLRASGNKADAELRLAIESGAELFQRAETDRLGAAGLEHRQVLRRDSHFLGERVQAHFSPGEHEVDIDDDRHGRGPG